MNFIRIHPCLYRRTTDLQYPHHNNEMKSIAWLIYDIHSMPSGQWWQQRTNPVGDCPMLSVNGLVVDPVTVSRTLNIMSRPPRRKGKSDLRLWLNTHHHRHRLY